MHRTAPILFFALVALGFGGCASFYDLDDLQVMTSSDSGDTDGTNTQSTSDTHTQATDTGTGSQTSTGTGTDTETPSVTGSNTSETDTGTETESPSESLSDTASVTGTDTDTPSDTGSASESVTVDTVTCDDDTVCEAFTDGQCSPLCDTETIDCGCPDSDEPYCVENGCRQCNATHDELCAGYFCDPEALACDTDCEDEDFNCQGPYHCEGQACVPDLESGAACDEPSDCQPGLDCLNEVCCQEGMTCCSDVTDCSDTDEPICDTDPAVSYCKPCTQLDLCEEQHTTAPVCATDGACVECVEHGDCRPQDTDTATPEKAWASPYGVCTPDRTCTCWVDSAFPTTNCNASGCPSNYVCAKDPSGTTHFACLRLCDSQDTDTDISNDYVNGLGCTKRSDTIDTDTQEPYVWAPPTTCHAFAMIGQTDCTGLHGFCSVDGEAGINDGWCAAGQICTYSCANDGYCETDSTDTDSEGCDSSGLYFGRCLP